MAKPCPIWTQDVCCVGCFVSCGLGLLAGIPSSRLDWVQAFAGRSDECGVSWVSEERTGGMWSLGALLVWNSAQIILVETNCPLTAWRNKSSPGSLIPAVQCPCWTTSESWGASNIRCHASLFKHDNIQLLTGQESECIVHRKKYKNMWVKDTRLSQIAKYSG